jgi:hypothetical protein
VTTAAVRYDRMLRGLAEYVEALTPAATTVVWSGDYPRESATPRFVTLNKIAGPRSAGAGGRSRFAAVLPMTATLTVTAATEGESATLVVSGRRFSYQAESGDDVEAVRDGLLAAIGSSPLVSATFVAAGTDEITITALSLGDVYDLSASGLAEVAVDTEQACKVQLDEVLTVVDLQAFAIAGDPIDGADSLVANMVGAHELDAAQRILDAYGLGVHFGDPVNLDSLAGPRWESRVSVPVTVSQISLSAAATDQVREVRVTTTVRTPANEIADSMVVLEP